MLRRLSLPLLRRLPLTLPRIPLGARGDELLAEARIRFVAWWEGYDLEAYRHWLNSRKGGDPKAEIDTEVVAQRGLDRHGKPLWTATRIEVAEKIWGSGFVSPGGEQYIPELVKPLGLNPAMSVLDMSAGLGGAARAMVASFGTWITGLEANPLLAAEGMDRSKKSGMAKQAPIAPYDPEEFKYSKRVDCIFAKELFFAVKNKDHLFDGIERAMKPRGQLLFTDYVYAEAKAEGPVIDRWRGREPLEPHPWTLAEVENALRQRNLDLRIAEDETELHRTQIVTAIQRLQEFLAQHTTDAPTRQAVIEEVELWGTRVAALDAGLRCYRFYALKPSS